jgi:hypothetical protein
MNHSRFTSVMGGVLVSAFALACADTAPTGLEADFAIGDRNDNYELQQGVVNVCAFLTGDPVNFTANFTAEATEGAVWANFSLTHMPPLCIEVWNQVGSTAINATVTATLPEDPAGLTLDRIVTLRGDGIAPNEGQALEGVRSASLDVSNVVGGYIWFKLVPAETPPPGGQGCTPGYWRQSQHFSSWTGYSPTDLFSSVFADAFPGKTLLEVVWLGGGGLNALGRMSVAALLNAASPDVTFDLTTQQVIDAFNAAYASGNKRTIEQQKNIFDFLNNQGCPL